ncbi:MAG: hypothetical protein VW625_07060 [Perlucidibaca sp.]
MSRRGNDFRQLWGMPALLAVFTLIGLCSALTGEGGIHYWASWLLLAIPVAVAGWFSLRR